LYPLSDEIIANSQGVADDLAKVINLPRERINVVYNPTISPNLFKKAKRDLHHPWFDCDEPSVILGAGRLEPQKDFSTLIDAFWNIKRRQNARLMILGEGSRRSKLEEQITKMNLEDEVSLPGFTDNPYKYMRNASVFVLSSSHEGLPNVLIEAMACGCPVVSTNCPSGPSEILDDGKYGPLIPVGDPDRLAEAIVTVLEEPIDPNVLRGRAMDFSLESTLDRFESVLVSDISIQ